MIAFCEVYADSIREKLRKIRKILQFHSEIWMVAVHYVAAAVASDAIWVWFATVSQSLWAVASVLPPMNSLP